MKKISIVSTVLCVLILSIVSCKKENTKTGESICNGNSDEVIGGYAGSHRIFIGPVDLVAANIMSDIDDDLLCTSASNDEIQISFDYLGFTMTGNLNNVSNNVLTLDSLILNGRAANFSTDGHIPGISGDIALYNLRAGGTVTFNCNGTITTDFRVKSCSTNIVNPLDTFQNLQILDGKNLRLVGTFTKQ